MSDAWSKVSPSRRSFLQKLVGTTFVVPLLSSFSMSGPTEALADKGAAGTIGKAEMNVEFKVAKGKDPFATGDFTARRRGADFENKNKTTDAAGLATKGGGVAFENKNKTTDSPGLGRVMMPFKTGKPSDASAGFANGPGKKPTQLGGFKVGKPSDDSAGKGSYKPVVTTEPAGASTTTVPTTGTR